MLKRVATRKAGFSLMELMVVLTILAFLAASGIPSYLNYLRRASLAESVSVLGDYKTAIGVFWSTEGRLPGAGDTLISTPADLPFDTTVTEYLPNSIESITLSDSGNGKLISIVINAPAFALETTNNRTISLGIQSRGKELDFKCGNFTTNASAIADVGFTKITDLPVGCDYNGVGAWLAGTEEESSP